MKKLFKLLKNLDNSLLTIASILFIFFIPLYPKFPLKFIEYTYVAIRVDDLFVAFYCLLFTIQLVRRKAQINMYYIKLFGLFWGAIFLSLISGILITKTVIHPNIGLMHAFRRVEYMIVFFIVFASIRSKNDAWRLLTAYTISFGIVLFYGIGQKFFGLPAVQTMNPEFARGHLLYLTPEARVSSTFAGHYDFAAYLVFSIPLIWGIMLSVQRKIVKTFLFGISITAIFLLVLTASRTSFISYIVSAPIFLFANKKFRLGIIILIISIVLTTYSQDMIKRWIKTIQIKQILVNERTGEVYIPQKSSPQELPAGSLYIRLEKQEPIHNETILYKQSIIQKEILNEASRAGRVLTASETANIVATLSGDIKPVSGALYDTSIATRFQVEWPRAIKAFLKNPLLGSGPSSITEATDGDYFRWIGEFGLLGTSIFLGLLFFLHKSIFFFWRNIKTNKKYMYGSVLFGTGGLLVTAGFIDVFEASKVAYTFWFIMGIIISLSTFEQYGKIQKNKQKKI